MRQKLHNEANIPRIFKFPRKRVFIQSFILIVSALSFFVYNLQPFSVITVEDESDLAYQTKIESYVDSELIPQLFNNTIEGISDCFEFLENLGSSTYDKTSRISPTLKPTIDANLPQIISFIHYNANLSNPKYLCAVESAARHNPDFNIQIYATNRNEFNAHISKWLQLLPKSMARRIATVDLDWETAFIETPLEAWWRNKTWTKSRWVDQNLGNAYRLGQLWKNGGVYLDLDLVSLNPLRPLGRSVAYQDSKRLNNAYFNVRKHDEFIWMLMEEFVSSFNGYAWSYNGPQMVTRAYQKNCASQIKPIAYGCNITTLSTAVIFPIQYEERKQLFESWNSQCRLLKKISSESVAIHLWSKKTGRIPTSDQALISVFMRTSCPAVFEAFEADELGISSQGVLGLAEFAKADARENF